MRNKLMDELRRHGGPMLRVKRRDLVGRGVERVTSRIVEVRDGRPVVDGAPRDVSTVVWATGFRQVFDWIHLPILGEDGWPREMRGVVADAPGLFFCGLCFQYAFSSMVLPGVGRDAAYVADRIAARSSSAKPVDARPAPRPPDRRTIEKWIRPLTTSCAATGETAYDAWSRTGLDGLGASELERFSTAAGLAGHHDDLVRALQRAFLAFQDEGDTRGAARCAFHLSMNTADHGEHALAAGWGTRTAELVDEIGEDCVERRLGRVPADVPGHR